LRRIVSRLIAAVILAAALRHRTKIHRRDMKKHHWEFPCDKRSTSLAADCIAKTLGETDSALAMSLSAIAGRLEALVRGLAIDRQLTK
jgi:hypothetical protein